MVNLSFELKQVPFPHMIVRDVISDETLKDYLCNNNELTEYMKDRKNLERVEFYGSKKDAGGRKTFLPDNKFSQTFNDRVSKFLNALKTNRELSGLIKNTFTPMFESFYGDFKESFEKSFFTYGAYNGTSVEKNIIGWHLDQGDKLISGFIYLKEDGDVADDGHLYLSNGDEQKRIDYENNVMILWPNLPNAWHMAGVRNPTKHLRRLVNIVYKSDQGDYHNYRTRHSKKVVDAKELYQHKLFGFRGVKYNERKEGKVTEKIWNRCKEDEKSV